MRYTKEKQKEHISRIRRVLVMKSDASILEIRELLQKSRPSLKLDKDYINKLVNKIRKERVSRLDHYTVNKILTQFEDEVNILKQKLWIIINNISTTDKDKTAAIRELRNSSKDLFDKMFDAGIFKRQLGEGTFNLISLIREANKDAKGRRKKGDNGVDKS